MQRKERTKQIIRARQNLFQKQVRARQNLFQKQVLCVQPQVSTNMVQCVQPHVSTNTNSSSSDSDSSSDVDFEDESDDGECGEMDIIEGDYVIIKVEGKKRLVHYIAWADVVDDDYEVNPEPVIYIYLCISNIVNK